MRLLSTTLVLGALLSWSAHAHAARAAAVAKRLVAVTTRIHDLRQRASGYQTTVSRAEALGVQPSVRKTAQRNLTDARSKAVKATRALRDARRSLTRAGLRGCGPSCRHALLESAIESIASSERIIEHAWLKLADAGGQIYLLSADVETGP